MKDSRVIIGGQAVIEGVMMRSPRSFAVAVRRPDGSIAIMTERIGAPADAHPVLALPIVRGAAMLLHSMTLGIRALNFSAAVAAGHEHPAQPAIESKESEGAGVKASTNRRGKSVGSSLAMTLTVNAVLFIAVPLLVTSALFGMWRHAPAGDAWPGIWELAGVATQPGRPSLAFNMVDGVIRIGLFLVLVSLMSRVRDVRRLFEYHGAEHKVVYAWESGEEPTVENARARRCEHPRCGTSFLMLVMILAAVAFLFVRFESFAMNLLARMALAPVVAGATHEVIRGTVKGAGGIAARVVSRPGLWLQRITTREPDEMQLEVAVRALNEVIGLERADASVSA